MSQFTHLIRSNVLRNIYKIPKRSLSTINSNQDNTSNNEEIVKKSGFAEAYKKHLNIFEKKETPDTTTFASLLRNSKFIDMGDPAGKQVEGKIFHIVGEDLYIDFGWKFHCVCKLPIKNPELYVRGAKVSLKIKELELSTKFLGHEKDITILESDCILLGIISSPASKNPTL